MRSALVLTAMIGLAAASAAMAQTEAAKPSAPTLDASFPAQRTILEAQVRLAHARVKSGKHVTVAATAYVYTNGRLIALRGVDIRLAGKRAKTSPTGHAKLAMKLTRGTYTIQAFYTGLRSATRKIRAT